MKKEKNKEITLDDVHHEISKLRNELTILIRDLIEVIDKKFLLMDNKIGGLELNLSSRITGLGNRIDDLAENRVKYSDFDKLRKEVELIRTQNSVKTSKKQCLSVRKK